MIKYGKKYRSEHKEYFAEYAKEYVKDNDDVKRYRKKYNKQYWMDNKDKLSKNRKKYICKNKNFVKNSKKKYLQSKAVFKTFSDRLTVDEQSRLAKDGISLEVKCRYCGKYFIPTKSQVFNRIHALNNGYDNGLYCSNECKVACPIYRKISWPSTYKEATSREVQPELRKMVLKRDDYTCQTCGLTNIELHCHHIYPLNESPITSADINECITLCKECHKLKHKIPGCGYNELKCYK